jgi:hypothetical protein
MLNISALRAWEAFVRMAQLAISRQRSAVSKKLQSFCSELIAES